MSITRREFVKAGGWLAAATALGRQGNAADKPGTQPWFTDIAPRSRFQYRTNNGLNVRKYFPQPMCGGVGILDYDNDGNMDIFLTNGAHFPDLTKIDPSFYNCLLRNRGDGTFEDVTAKAGVAGEQLGYSFGVACADYDNDGWDDLFVCNAERNALYHNNGNGTFTDITASSGLNDKPVNELSVGAAWFDFDNDGLLDLIISNYTNWNPAIDRPCVMGNNTNIFCTPTLYPSVSPRLYKNLGNGRFQDVTSDAGLGLVQGKGMGISVADFNNDGLMDIFISNDTERNFLFINQGNGTFKEEGVLYGVAYNLQGTTVSGMGSDAKDFDNDGYPDIIYNDLAGQIFALLHNNAGLAFDDVTWQSNVGNLSRPFSGWGIGFIDYDNDGWKDIYSANGDVDSFSPESKQHDTMFKNIGGTKFIDVSSEMGQDFGVKGYQRGSAFVDLNNDGFLDIVVTSLSEKPRILKNNGLSGNHWIMLDLCGRKSNRSGIGARIKVTTASGRTLFNHATTSIGLMSSSDRRVHFGLGKEESIREIEIRWPSGILQCISAPGINQILKVVEPHASSDSHVG